MVWAVVEILLLEVVVFPMILISSWIMSGYNQALYPFGGATHNFLLRRVKTALRFANLLGAGDN